MIIIITNAQLSEIRRQQNRIQKLPASFCCCCYCLALSLAKGFFVGNFYFIFCVRFYHCHFSAYMIYTMRARIHTHTRTCCNYCTHTHTPLVVVCLCIFVLYHEAAVVLDLKTNHFCNNVSGAAHAQAGYCFS